MYHAFFNLREPPFSIAPDPSYLYLSARHQEALGHLLYGTGQYGGFVQLTGEVGTGKTTIIRTLLAQKLDDVDVAMIHNPRQNEQEFIASICDELRLPYPPEATLKTLVDALNRHLLATHAAGRRAVLIIDEAQNLQPGVLEQVRLLTNLETDKEKLLRIMLVGQPELIELLARPDLRQLAGRITARYHLLPLTRDETREYIQHRMSVAGGNPDVFTGKAIASIYRNTQGIPRQINIVCDRALLGAYAKGLRVITPEIVGRAVDETLGGAPVSAYSSRYRAFMHWMRSLPMVWIEAFVACLALIVMGVLLARALGDHRPAAAPPAVASAPAPASVPAPAPGAAKPTIPDEPLSGAAALAELRRGAQPLAASMGELIQLWQPGLKLPQGENICDALSDHQLGCYRGNGDWDELTTLNHPALLTLNLGSGQPLYVLMRALDDNTVTLLGADGPRRYRIDQIDGLWTGEFLMLWQRPSELKPVAPGSSGASVQWVRRQLGAAGDHAADNGSARYDAALGDALRRFQQSKGLVTDGIAGTRSLIALSDVTAAPDAPVLSPAAKP